MGGVMKRLLISGVGLLSALMVLEPALAADVQVQPKRERQAQRPAQQRAPAQQQASQQSSNWSGGQLGGSNGVSSVSNNFAEPGAYVCPSGFPLGVSCFENLLSFSGHKTSYTIGPFVGWRWQVGKSPYGGPVVLGVEADWSWKNAETSGFLTAATCFGVGCPLVRTDGKTGSLKQTWDASIRGRVGYLVTPFTMVYGTGGVAFGEVKGSFSYNGVILSCTTSGCVPSGTSASALANWSDTRVGGTGGAGIETDLGAWGFWRGVKARVEYRYTDFGSQTKTFPVATICGSAFGCNNPSGLVSIGTREFFHTVRVGLGVDF
jgi:outer membrane immunogenic protein